MLPLKQSFKCKQNLRIQSNEFLQVILTSKNCSQVKENNNEVWWPTTFLPAAKGSARTPLGPKVSIKETKLGQRNVQNPKQS